MESVAEIPMFIRNSNDFEFDSILKSMINGSPLHIKRKNRPYVYEKLCELVGENSFEQSKEYWIQIKSVFHRCKKNKPFVYFKDNQFILSDGSSDEDLSFVVSFNDDLLYEGYPVVINPLLLQKLYTKYQNENNSKESDEYAHYCITRELEKHQVKIIEKYI